MKKIIKRLNLYNQYLFEPKLFIRFVISLDKKKRKTLACFASRIGKISSLPEMATTNNKRDAGGRGRAIRLSFTGRKG